MLSKEHQRQTRSNKRSSCVKQRIVTLNKKQQHQARNNDNNIKQCWIKNNESNNNIEQAMLSKEH
jgi:hypothetical protein